MLLSRFAALGVKVWQDSAGKVIAITAHKDEIGAVKTVNVAHGSKCAALGGAFPCGQLRQVARQQEIPIQLAVTIVALAAMPR